MKISELTDLAGEYTLYKIAIDPCSHVQGVMMYLDGALVYITEDEGDGYRSYHNTPIIFEGSCSAFDKIFNSKTGDLPFIRRKVIITHKTDNLGEDFYGDGSDAIQVHDKETGKLILNVGTANIGDYYPSYIQGYYGFGDITK